MPGSWGYLVKNYKALSQKYILNTSCVEDRKKNKRNYINLTRTSIIFSIFHIDMIVTTSKV